MGQVYGQYGVLTPLSTLFQLYRGRNWSTQSKPPTCRKSLTKSHNVHRVHLALSGIWTHFSVDRHWLHRLL